MSINLGRSERIPAGKQQQSAISGEAELPEPLPPVTHKVEWRSNRLKPGIKTRDEFFAALDEIAARSSTREPCLDHRSADEIIGYDDFGLPR